MKVVKSKGIFLVEIMKKQDFSFLTYLGNLRVVA